MKNIVLCEPLRTPVGTFGGALKDVSAIELGTTVVKEVIERSKIDSVEINDCVMGNILGAGLGQNPSRQIAVNSGLGFETPAFTLNRVCGSGLQSVILAAQSIKAGDAECVIAGGIENMSQAPFYLKKARWGYKMGMPGEEITDGMVYDGLWDIFNDYHMGITAENLADKYSVTRKMQDEFAYKSQMKAKAAIENGNFKEQIVPVLIPGRKGKTVEFNTDEHPRADITVESLGNLKPVFKKDGTVTAGNSSGINDGAAALLVLSESRAGKLGINPCAYLRSYSVTGVDPSVMGIGPVTAIEKALSKADLTIDDVDLVELNEAFAAQSLACLCDLKIPEEKLNIHGGAIALGHPIGASGAIVLVKLLHQMKQNNNAKTGLCALCIGGGMGIAMVVEKV